MERFFLFSFFCLTSQTNQQQCSHTIYIGQLLYCKHNDIQMYALAKLYLAKTHPPRLHLLHPGCLFNENNVKKSFILKVRSIPSTFSCSLSSQYDNRAVSSYSSLCISRKVTPLKETMQSSDSQIIENQQNESWELEDVCSNCLKYYMHHLIFTMNLNRLDIQSQH